MTPRLGAVRVREHLDAGADHACIRVVGLAQGVLAREEWRRPAPALVG